MCLLVGVGAYQLGTRSQDAVEQLQVEFKAASRKDVLLGGLCPLCKSICKRQISGLCARQWTRWLSSSVRLD